MFTVLSEIKLLATKVTPLLIKSSMVLCTTYPETTEYLDRPSIHFPPISDAFVNKVFFLYYTNDSSFTLLRNSLVNMNQQNIFFIVIKST